MLVKYNNSTAIWVCFDLTLAPALIIETYTHHFKIEYMYNTLTNIDRDIDQLISLNFSFVIVEAWFLMPPTGSSAVASMQC